MILDTLKKSLNPNPILFSKDAIILGFRVLISISMIHTHGIKKIIHFSDTVQHIPDPLGIGGELSTYFALLGNIVCPILVILGLTTRLATLPILSITLMGLLVVHSADPWTIKDVPLMYTIAYLLVFFFGAGKYSLDNRLFNPKTV